MAKATEETPTKRVGNPELLAINAICKAFDSLPQPVQKRVLAYVQSKYAAEWDEQNG